MAENWADGRALGREAQNYGLLICRGVSRECGCGGRGLICGQEGANYGRGSAAQLDCGKKRGTKQDWC